MHYRFVQCVPKNQSQPIKNKRSIMERNQSPYVYEPNAEGVRNFHIGDILSITTGRLVSPRRMDGVYDILNYMTGDDLFTHQLIRAAEECAPALREQHPDLTDVDVPEEFHGEEHVQRWLGDLVMRHGESRPVMPLHPEEHTVIDPIAEAHFMGFGHKVMPFTLPEDPEPEF